MHPRLEELLAEVQDKFQLHKFRLISHFISKEKTINNQLSHVVSFELTPEQLEENFYRSETVLIDLDLHTGQIIELSYPPSLSYPAENVFPTGGDTEMIIDWVEKETNLLYGKQFKIEIDRKHLMVFEAAADTIPVHPSGEITLDFTEEGEFFHFTIEGVFPSEEAIAWEPFSLTEEQVIPFAKQAIEQVLLPINEDKLWIPSYLLAEQYITNDGKQLVNEENYRLETSYRSVNQVIKWDYSEPPIELPNESIDLTTETTIEAALENKQEKKSISIEEQDNLIKNVTSYIATIYPNDSNKWKLAAFYIKGNYIIARLIPHEKVRQIPHDTLTIYFDKYSLEAMNHETNSYLMFEFEDFTKATNFNISHEDAYQLLEQYIKVEPVYVYNKTTEQYEVCGKIHCNIAVLAQTGEIIPLS